jgi:hypothetical protein
MLQKKSHKTLAMAYDSFHNNPQDLPEEIFVRLEEQFVDISRNISCLLEAIESKLGPLGEDGVSNSKIGSKGRLGDNEYPEKESKKEPEKEQPSRSVITP